MRIPYFINLNAVDEEWPMSRKCLMNGHITSLLNLSKEAHMMKRWFVFALALVIILSVNASAVVASKSILQENQPASFLSAEEPSARYGHSMVNLNGKACLFGGATAFISDTVPISSSAAVNGHAPASMLLNSISIFDIDLRRPERTRRNRPNASMLLNDISIFDPELAIWSPEELANNPPPARYKHSAVALGEKMYILFGEGASGLLQDIWVYDPNSKLWQELVISSGSKPAARTGHTTVTMYGAIFVYGGKTATGAVNDLWSFDLRSNTWMQRGNGANAVYGHTAVADTGSKMYVFGGYDGTNYQLDLMSYDLNTNTWENIAVQGNLPSPRAFHVAWFEDPNKMTIATGRGYNSSRVLTDLDDTWEFDTVAVKWASKAKTSPHSFSSAVVIPKSSDNLSQFQNLGLAPRATSGTVILFFGGLRDGQTIAETFVYTGQYLLYLPLIVR